MFKELAANLILFTVLAVAAGMYMYSYTSRGDAIVDCMAERGDLHSQAIYTECVEATQ